MVGAADQKWVFESSLTEHKWDKWPRTLPFFGGHSGPPKPLPDNKQGSCHSRMGEKMGRVAELKHRVEIVKDKIEIGRSRKSGLCRDTDSVDFICILQSFYTVC